MTLRKPGPAAASGSSGGNVAHAAAPGGEDAEALLRDCEFKASGIASALRDNCIDAALDMADALTNDLRARLAARAGGSRG